MNIYGLSNLYDVSFFGILGILSRIFASLIQINVTYTTIKKILNNIFIIIGFFCWRVEKKIHSRKFILYSIYLIFFGIIFYSELSLLVCIHDITISSWYI